MKHIGLGDIILVFTYVLETGSITTGGKASELAESEAIKKAYLGG